MEKISGRLAAQGECPHSRSAESVALGIEEECDQVMPAKRRFRRKRARRTEASGITKR